MMELLRVGQLTGFILRIACAAFLHAANAGHAGAEHYVPAEKNLSEQWLESLYARGERTVYRDDELFTIGMPCGGVGAGQLYVRGDGTLARWWIFNESYITDFRRKDPLTGYRTFRPPSEIEQGFAISVAKDGSAVQTLPLSHDGFTQIGFIGEYPIATIQYEGAKADAWPVEVTAEVYSPYIPLNTKDSGLPATILSYTIKNTSSANVRCRIGGWLQNAPLPSADDSTPGRRRNRVVQGNAVTAVVFDLVDSENAPPSDTADQQTVPFDDFESPIVRSDGTTVENGSLAKWRIDGEPIYSKAPSIRNELSGVKSVQGMHALSSSLAEQHSGKVLSSVEFTIEQPYLTFLLGSIRQTRWYTGNAPEIQLLVADKVVRSAKSEDAHGEDKYLRRRTWDVRELEGKQARIVMVDGNRTMNLVVDDIQQSSFDPQREQVLPTWNRDFGDMTLALLDPRGQAAALAPAGPDAIAPVDGDLQEESRQESFSSLGSQLHGSVTSPVLELAPGDEATVTYVISWFFPNYVNDQKGCPGDVGRMYDNWFDSSTEVAEYVAQHFDRLSTTTHEFREAMYLDTTLPYWFTQRTMAANANLASAAVEWWRNGRMYSWEGVGFCIGTCGHVWNYTQGPSRLFPELERSVRTMQDFDPEVAWKPTGRINFRGYNDNTESFDQWGYIPDAQCGYVLKAYREHLMSPDNAYLDELWPRIKRSTEYLIERDGRHGEVNGILEGMQHLTDSLAWGPNTFTGSLYLAALRASEEMARLRGDDEFADECRRLYESGRQWTLENLWNGEYFVHIYSPAPAGALPNNSKGTAYSEGCLADQVFGQNWAHQLGLGYVYPADKVSQSLRSVFKYNWTPDVSGVYEVMTRRFILLANEGEPGMVGVTYPLGPPPANRIAQNDDPWTGYEYQVAAGMLWEGLLEEGLSIAYGVHQRYQAEKHNPWNEIEGGDHYTRSMASWGMLLAASGYEYDGPAGRLGFAPRLSPQDFRSVFTAAEGWGTLSQQRADDVQTNEIQIRWGELKLRTLVVELPAETRASEVAVEIGGQQISHQFKQEENKVTIELGENSTCAAGQIIAIHTTYGK